MLYQIYSYYKNLFVPLNYASVRIFEKNTAVIFGVTGNIMTYVEKKY